MVSGSVRGPFGVRLGSVQDPFGVRLGSVRGPFGVRLASVRDPFGIRSGFVRGPFGNLLGTHQSQKNRSSCRQRPIQVDRAEPQLPNRC